MGLKRVYGISVEKRMTKILVIEDELSVREIICEILIAEKFDVFGAENGQMGVQLAQDKSPDLILCDIMMPVLNGYEVLSELRRNQITAVTPFIFITAKASNLDLRQGMALGADDYITKPFTRDDLLCAVSARLDRQVAMMRSCIVEHQRCKEIEKKVKNLQQFVENREEIFQNFSENLRNSVAKINMAIHMMRNAQPGVQRDRYLEILQAECDEEINLLNQVTELRSFLTPENFHLLKQYKLLRSKN